MYKTNLLRIIKTGFQNFWRNSWLSAATISIIVLTLFVISSLLLLNVISQSLVASLENKVDVSAYFNSESPENDILAVRQDLIKLPEVKSAEYVSKDEALKQFKETHKDNSTLLQSLSELDDNPLQASLNIKAQSASQFEAIANFLEQSKYASLINKVNYHQNREVINRVSSLATNIGRGGIIASFILALMAVFVTFNTVRLTMYNWKDEISVMRLVGAGNWYIRGPFVVEGIIYGILAAFFTLIILYPILYFVSPKITSFLPEVDLLYFFEANIWQILMLLVGVGAALGSLSSLIAIRRYLRV
jgi:cell division transport system permease protein